MRDTAAQPSLRERVGGRWAVSWQGYLIFLPVSTVFILTTTPALMTGGGLLVGLWVSLLAYAATGVVQGVAAVTVLRHRVQRPVQVWLVVMVGGLSWMARSLVLWWALQSMDLDSLAGLPERLVFGFALGAFIVPIAGAGLGNVARFRQRREEMLETLVEAEIAADRETAYVDALRIGLVEEVSRAVGSARQRMDAIDLSSESMPQEALEALERASEEGIRRVSRETWQEGRTAARLRVMDLVRAAASGRALSVWGVLLVVGFGYVVIVREQEWRTAVGVAVTAAVYLLAVVLVVNADIRAGRAPVPVYVIGLVALALTGPVVLLLTGVLGIKGTLGAPFALLSSVAAIVVIPWTGAARAFGRSEERVLASLRGSIDDAQVRGEALAEQERRLRRQIATQLHGTVGANLTAATMRLRQAIDTGDTEKATNALFEARRLLDADLGAVLLAQAGDVSTALEELAESWAGLVEVMTTVDVGSLNAPQIMAVVDVVTEAINNAVRHGGARMIEVSVTSKGRAVEVVVMDDGRRPEVSVPGIGSRVFDEIAPGAWSREERPGGGCRVTVRIGGDLP